MLEYMPGSGEKGKRKKSGEKVSLFPARRGLRAARSSVGVRPVREGGTREPDSTDPCPGCGVPKAGAGAAARKPTGEQRSLGLFSVTAGSPSGQEEGGSPQEAFSAMQGSFQKQAGPGREQSAGNLPAILRKNPGRREKAAPGIGAGGNKIVDCATIFYKIVGIRPARSCPQAAAMSPPMLLRRITVRRLLQRMRSKARTASGAGARKGRPGTGL